MIADRPQCDVPAAVRRRLAVQRRQQIIREHPVPELDVLETELPHVARRQHRLSRSLRQRRPPGLIHRGSEALVIPGCLLPARIHDQQPLPRLGTRQPVLHRLEFETCVRQKGPCPVRRHYIRNAAFLEPVRTERHHHQIRRLLRHRHRTGQFIQHLRARGPVHPHAHALQRRQLRPGQVGGWFAGEHHHSVGRRNQPQLEHEQMRLCHRVVHRKSQRPQ